MYHKLRFRANFEPDLHLPGKARLERAAIAEGAIIEAQVRPFVQETPTGPIEVADLHLASDGTLLAVPMEYFEFV